MTYPNSRSISFTHDALHRLTAITESGNTIADYTYKGGYLQDRGVGNYNDTRVVKLTYKDSSDLDGYDAWGRVVWMRNHMVSGGADIAKFGYAYSYASNRKYQEDLVTSTQSELYAYDNLYRLTSFKRGTLNANKDDITGTPVREQTWALDDLGNWSELTSRIAGNLVRRYEDRTHNSANEITEIDPLDISGDNPDAYAGLNRRVAAKKIALDISALSCYKKWYKTCRRRRDCGGP